MKIRDHFFEPRCTPASGYAGGGVVNSRDSWVADARAPLAEPTLQ